MVYAEHPIAYNILLWVLSLLGTLITSIIIPVVFRLLAAKTKNEKLKMVMEEIANTTKSSVSYTNQTFVDQLKHDGKFDAEAQKEAMLRSTNYTFDTLTASTKKIIEQEGINLDLLVKKYIEADIDDRHREKEKNGVKSKKKKPITTAASDEDEDVMDVDEGEEEGIDDEPVG